MTLAGLLRNMDIEANSRLLEQRDRKALLFYGVSGFVIVLGSEAVVFHFNLSDHYGFMPIFARGVLYLLLTTLLWASLLRINRRAITALLVEKQNFYESLLLAHDNALSLKDAYTGGHGRRVARYTHLIAGAMGLQNEDADLVREAARLHDIGKIGIPECILNKAGQLTATEFAVVRKHSTAGADILRSIPSLRRLAIAVRHHHEHFDGSGYPDRLQGMMIPIASRIIAVADTFDALTTSRSYREACPPHEALDELVKAAGSHLDPDIVSIIMRQPFRDALCVAHGEMA